MNITHHPKEEMLLDYATGALGETWSLAVATHLALCPACRKAVAVMEDIGGNMLETVTPAPISDRAFDALMARLDDKIDEPTAPISVVPPTGDAPVLPQPLRDYVGSDLDGVQWKRLGMGARQFIIPTRQKSVTSRLLRIPAGRPVPEHSHNGQELTLVLCGAFEDKTGYYGRGDLQEADGSIEHQPHAASGEDCICLAITDAPLRFRSLAARIVQPVLHI